MVNIRAGRLVAAITACFFLRAPPPAAAQVLNFRQYGGVDGLPQIQVIAMQQDHRGFFWFGTYGGVSRFDGAAFRTYTMQDGLTSNTIRALSEDAARRLIVATDRGVCWLADGYANCPESLYQTGILDLLPVGDTLWIATETGLLRAVGDSVHRYTDADGLPGAAVHRLARDPAGVIWAGTSRGLVRRAGARFMTVADDVFGDRAVRALLWTRRGLVVAVDQGVYQDSGGSFVQLPIPVGGPGRTPVDAAVDASDRLWIATRSGAFRLDSLGVVRIITKRNGLATDLINRVTVDRENNVWFGTDDGLSKLVPGPFVHLTDAEGLPSPFVRALTRAHDGRLWAGTRRGLAVLDGEVFRPLDLGSAIADSRIFALAPFGAAEVLAGTREGLLRAGDAKPRLYTMKDGLPSNSVSSIVAAPDGGYWVGTIRGLVHWRDGEFEVVQDSALRDVAIQSLAVDAAGRVWVGLRSGGVRIYDGRSTHIVGEAEGLSNEAIWSIGRDGRGWMWVGTNGDGAFGFEPGAARPARQVTERHGLGNNFVWQVLADARGNVWFYTGQGLSRLSGDEMAHFGRGDGLIDLEGSANTTLEDADGTLWFGTGTGLVRYSPALERTAHTVPPIYIEELSADGERIDEMRARVPPGAGVIQIGFAAPSYRDESAIRFRYRLRGATERWSEPTADREIRYAGLGPGRYVFQVVAFERGGGSPSEPATLTFTVLPAFWQTWWFRTVVLLLLAGSIAGAARLRVRRLEAERRRLEALVDERTGALRESEQRLRDIFEHSTNLFYMHDAAQVLTYVSPQTRQFLDCDPEEAKRRWTEFLSDHPANAVGQESTARALATGERQPTYELELRTVTGRRVWVAVNEAPVVRDGHAVAMVGSLTDITEAKKAAADRERLELQLRRSQRMQAVGQLAGGIAHDFNNLLTAVLGNTQLIADQLGPDHPLAEELAEVRRSSERAASLVAQLLAFSRKQLVKPTTLDLNVVVNESARMLRRLIGEDVVLHLDLAEQPAWIEADPSQLDQVLINLAVNARDAMPMGGSLTIATAQATLDAPLPEEGGEEIPAGRYVMLTVRDTGCGMEAETRGRAFEPFFTTKEVGKGTGLGLSTVYGIIKQNQGHVRLESEPCKGATFRIYLPPATRPAPAVAESEVAAPKAPAPKGDDRVVLVVEDEHGVRDFVCRTLRRYGYRILEAPDGPTALAISAAHTQPIHLLLSDMVMPGMTGKAVADRLTAERKETRVLFMSGYTRDALGERGILAPRTELLQKPFSPGDLAQRVQQVLS